ncbi:hypothetical protein Dsin_007992 [Dipteronia sinensis]|uniref:RNase H type-1 domain-containing protein n=1 Tax=Dipteronia sinensis TaxID=43782 RepID=A0AAE0EIY0_9ROSI|nr:hypothetical protein Dsin_007992 [Dipteronia sinensis]
MSLQSAQFVNGRWKLLFMQCGVIVRFRGVVNCVGLLRSLGKHSLFRWTPPTQAMYKLNFDAAIDVATGVVGVGLVIRYFTGRIMATSSQCIKATHIPLVAKAVAIYRGFQLACDSGLVPFDVASNAVVVVGLINDLRYHDFEVGLIIDGIQKFYAKVALLRHFLCL